MLKELVKAQLDSICGEISDEELNSIKSSCLYSIMNNRESETIEISDNFYFDKFKELDTLQIKANVISLRDLNIMSNLIKHLKGKEDESGEYYDYSLFKVEGKHLLDYDEMKKIEIPFCNPKAEISSTDTIVRNRYDSNCDTYGTLYGAKAYSLYFFYCPEINKYSVVEMEYYCY